MSLFLVLFGWVWLISSFFHDGGSVEKWGCLVIANVMFAASVVLSAIDRRRA